MEVDLAIERVETVSFAYCHALSSKHQISGSLAYSDQFRQLLGGNAAFVITHQVESGEQLGQWQFSVFEQHADSVRPLISASGVSSQVAMLESIGLIESTIRQKNSSV